MALVIFELARLRAREKPYDTTATGKGARGKNMVAVARPHRMPQPDVGSLSRPPLESEFGMPIIVVGYVRRAIISGTVTNAYPCVL